MILALEEQIETLDDLIAQARERILGISSQFPSDSDYRANPHGGAHRIPKKYEGQPMDKHSDLYTDEDPKGTIKGLGFKDKATAIKSVNIIKRSGKTHAHKIQAAMAMEQRARFHPNKTPGIKAAQKVYAKFIEEMKKKTKAKRNPRTFSGIKEAHEHYGYSGSHRTGSVIEDGVVVRSYSNNTGHDEVRGDSIRYMIKTDKIRTALKNNRSRGIPLRFFLKTGANEVTDMGLYNVTRLSKDFAKLEPEGVKNNPSHCPIEKEARRAASDPSFIHHEWYIEHHLDYVKAIAHALKPRAQPDEKEIINDMVWMHDYPKMMGDKDNFELVRNLVSKHKGKTYADKLVQYIDDMERIKSPDWNGQTTMYGAVMSTADALAHYYGPFWQIYMDENPDTPLAELKRSNAEKLEKDKRKLRAGPMKGALDSIKFQYKGRKVRVTGNEHIADLIERKNPRTPGGKKVPTRYLKGLTKLEKLIAEDEIDKGYKYDVNDPEAYKFWQSDIKATARGLKIGPSKHRIKYYKKYRKNINKDYKPSGKTPKQKFLNRIRKETKIKKSILEKIYDKGLAAWRTGHRPGVQQHQWAAGRVYAFVVGADSSTGPGKPDHKLAVEAGVR